jgi:hypothetical protein
MSQRITLRDKNVVIHCFLMYEYKVLWIQHASLFFSSSPTTIMTYLTNPALALFTLPSSLLFYQHIKQPLITAIMYLYLVFDVDKTIVPFPYLPEYVKLSPLNRKHLFTHEYLGNIHNRLTFLNYFSTNSKITASQQLHCNFMVA